MKKLTVIGIFVVILIYVISLLLKLNTVLIMFGCIMLAGLYFFINDGAPMNFNKPKNQTFIDLHSKEIEYINESQRKTGKNNSPIAMMLVAIALTSVLCIVHYNVFVKDDKVSTYDKDNYISYKLDKNDVQIYLDEDENITSLKILYYSSDTLDNVSEKAYANNIEYNDVLPIIVSHSLSVNENKYEIYINFYMEDFNYDDASALFTDLGLTHELSDLHLTFNELQDSSTFILKDVLTKGTIQDNRK